MLKRIQPEQIVDAKFVPPSTIEIQFADGGRYSLAIDLLAIPLDRVDWPTTQVSPSGDKIIVKGVKGDPIPIDSATLRYLVDDKYAAEMDARLKSLQFSEKELERIARENPPPPDWFSQPSRDLTRESWK